MAAGRGCSRTQAPPRNGRRKRAQLHTRRATEFARRQRKEPSRAEHLLWQSLRGSRLDGAKFKRQVPFGAYVADFSCASAKLIVEIDGPAHGERSAKDEGRDRWFEKRGYEVLRFSDEDVLMATNRVVTVIGDSLRTRRAPSPGLLRRPPSPSWGEG